MNMIAGFFAGLTASMGLGGGFILIIYLTVFAGVHSQAMAGGINLLFFLPIALVSTIIHAKNNLIEKKVLLIVCAVGIVGAVIGVYLISLLDENMLRKLFAALLVLVGVKELFHKKPQKE
ncbi:MAG: sulfite exporter TauE/SafE family protein [Oscillospiraceae bacterium]|nr:sulfite exporter TauE/SafE family protein [Oscillospiraceae bacterium]